VCINLLLAGDSVKVVDDVDDGKKSFGMSILLFYCFITDNGNIVTCVLTMA
jgi:hypothetical protein